MEREVGGGIRMGNTCKPMAVSFQCMTKSTTIKKIKNKKKKERKVNDVGLIPGSGRSPGGEHGNLFQYSCLENPLDRVAWKATVHGVAESETTEAT